MTSKKFHFRKIFKDTLLSFALLSVSSAPLSSRDVKLRYEECLQNWGNAIYLKKQCDYFILGSQCQVEKKPMSVLHKNSYANFNSSQFGGVLNFV